MPTGFDVTDMKILAYGELLWDMFPNEKRIGGAPFNFAAHTARLGAESLLVTSVGNDENGRDAINEVKKAGVSTEYITVNRRYPTGYCRVTLDNGMPQYELASDTAYDHIADVLPNGHFDALYMGTLASRSPDSRRTLEKILKHTSRNEVFFDVNLRKNFYSRDLINALMRETTILKMSDEEVPFIGRRDEVGCCLDLSVKYPRLKYICVTLGKKGAMVYDCRRRVILYSDEPKADVVSTVGAGDSFSACFLVDILSGKDVGQALDRAVRLSSFVVTQLGAVPEYDASVLFDN